MPFDQEMHLSPAICTGFNRRPS